MQGHTVLHRTQVCSEASHRPACHVLETPGLGTPITVAMLQKEGSMLEVPYITSGGHLGESLPTYRAAWVSELGIWDCGPIIKSCRTGVEDVGGVEG